MRLAVVDPRRIKPSDAHYRGFKRTTYIVYLISFDDLQSRGILLGVSQQPTETPEIVTRGLGGVIPTDCLLLVLTCECIIRTNGVWRSSMSMIIP